MEQSKKFEVTPADDITNPPQAPIPVTEMLLAQARVIAARRDLATSINTWTGKDTGACKAELHNALADLAEMELHQLKWNLLQQHMIQLANALPGGFPGHGPGFGPKIKM